LRPRQTICIALAILLLGIFEQSSAHADMSFSVSVNTSSLSGQSGYLDFQFNPGDGSAEAATATVTLFQTIGGVLSQPAALTGDATGSLPGTLTLDNGTVYNDIFQGFNYGNTFSFILTLSGPAVANPGGAVGSAFAVSLYAADGFTPLLTTDPNGSVATIDLNSNGTTSVFTFPQSSTDNTPAATVTSATVPEPSSTVYLACVAVSLLGYRLLRRAYGRLNMYRHNS
jgi:hypothetical protein